MILSGQPYKPLGAPPALERADASAMSRDINTSQASIVGEKTPEVITLALTTLGSFDFSGTCSPLQSGDVTQSGQATS